MNFRASDDFPVAPQREDDAEFELPFVEVHRADQNCLCDGCERPYRKHPYDQSLLDWNGHPWARVLCDGERVKL